MKKKKKEEEAKEIGVQYEDEKKEGEENVDEDG